jgi:asparagine synthase (glutamine-hydrolysing)
MSVLAGFWNFDARPADEELLKQFGSLAEHYGPNRKSFHLAKAGVGMCFSAFHTTPESCSEQQPMLLRHDSLMVWDGRLDNREYLLNQLSERSHSDLNDAAIVGRAFLRWGTGCFSRLRGDFAAAVWDGRNRELVLARDYIGVKHLFYSLRSGRIVWCTVLEPLISIGSREALCRDYIAGYLTLWPAANLSPYEGVKSVPPGGLVRIRDSGALTEMYWRFDPRLRTTYRSECEYEQHFEYLFRQSVGRRLRTNGPVLAGLSGGFDSTSVVCMADRVMKQQKCNVTWLDTFSFLNTSEPDVDDVEYFTEVEKWRGRKGTHICIEGQDLALCCKDGTFEPVPGPKQDEKIRAWLDAALQREYRVILSGTGGDEMLGQALNPRVLIADSIFHFNPRLLVRQLVDWGLLMRYPWLQLFVQSAARLAARPRFWLRCNVEHPLWVISPSASDQCAEPQVQLTRGAWFWSAAARDWFSTLVLLSRQLTYTPLGAQEIRYPFLDQDLVEFLVSIPSEQLLRPGERRSLMRRALKDLLPPGIVARRSKARGGRALITTVRKHWNELLGPGRTLLISELGYVDPTKFRIALERMKAGALSAESLPLLKALSLELWLRKATGQGIISIEKTRAMCRAA